METSENGVKVDQDGGGEASGHNKQSSPSSVATEEPATADANVEPDSTGIENPVNLKVDGDGEEPTNSDSAPTAQPEQQRVRSSPPPLLQHVRTITLTSDYRHQEHQNLESATIQLSSQEQQQHVQQQMGSSENGTLYVEEAADGHQVDGSYYQQHYTDENGTPVRYREIVTGHKSGVSQEELLDAAAQAAGVPTYNILMEGEEDEQDDRTSAYLGSRLATFQVNFHQPFVDL